MPLLHRYPAVLTKKRYCGGASFWPRMSETLAVRLHNSFLSRSALVHTWRIMDELHWLEGSPTARPTSTKPASPLGGPILGRFMHKHYTSSLFMGQNIYNQWFEGFGQKHQLLAAEIERVSPVGSIIEDEEDAWRKAGQIAHFVAMEGYQRKVKRQQVTGEWIVYYVHNGLNYYLDIALHQEAMTPERERALYDRLKATCAWEFPFAFDE